MGFSCTGGWPEEVTAAAPSHWAFYHSGNKQVSAGSQGVAAQPEGRRTGLGPVSSHTTFRTFSSALRTPSGGSHSGWDQQWPRETQMCFLNVWWMPGEVVQGRCEMTGCGNKLPTFFYFSEFKDRSDTKCHCFLGVHNLQLHG